MIQLHRILITVWILMGMWSAASFLSEVSSVSWFSILLSSVVPLGCSVFAKNKSADLSFFSILVYSLCGVAVLIVLAQSKMFSNISVANVALPIGSGLLWMTFHKSMKANKMP